MNRAERYAVLRCHESVALQVSPHFSAPSASRHVSFFWPTRHQRRNHGYCRQRESAASFRRMEIGHRERELVSGRGMFALVCPGSRLCGIVCSSTRCAVAPTRPTTPFPSLHSRANHPFTERQRCVPSCANYPMLTERNGEKGAETQETRQRRTRLQKAAREGLATGGVDRFLCCTRSVPESEAGGKLDCWISVCAPTTTES